MIRLLVFLCLLGTFFTSNDVYSHEVRPSYLEIIQDSEDTFQVMWKVPAKGDTLFLGLYVRFEESVENITEVRESFQGGAYFSRWKIKHQNALSNTVITIDGLESTFTEALVRIEYLDGRIQVSRLMPETPFVLVEESPSTLQIMQTYTGLGIKHILAGFDHLLFVICLLIIAGTARRVIITITGFTLAHSITLILSSLEIVQLAIEPVEAIIALSIVFLASEIARGKRNTLTWRYPLTVSISFGLLHGFGFAAVLNEIGLPQSELMIGLLFFNLGVEIGQLLFIAAVIILIKALMQLKWQVKFEKLQHYAIYGVGSLASFWLFERSASFLL